MATQPVTPKALQPVVGARDYEVFARRTQNSNLYHVGMVSAPNERLAQVQAVTTYDEHRWVELCLVPADQVLPVLGKRGERGMGIV